MRDTGRSMRVMSETQKDTEEVRFENRKRLTLKYMIYYNTY